MSSLLISTALFASCSARTEDTLVDRSAALDDQVDCGRFVIFDNADWKFSEAVDYPPDLGPLAAVEPSLDWYAEYERLIPHTDEQSIEGQGLRVSGHEVDLASHRVELIGANLTAATVNGKDALAGAGPDSKPAFVTVAFGENYTVMLLSYELASTDLLEIAGKLRPACSEEWVEAGGQVLECVPFDPDCIEGT